MSFIAVAVGGIVAAGIGAGGAIIAGNEQSNAAKSAAQLQYESQQQALQFQEQEWNQQQQNMAPWIKQGQSAVGTLGGLQNQALAGQGPLAPWTQQFQAPTAQQAAQYPGYQFALQRGSWAIKGRRLRVMWGTSRLRAGRRSASNSTMRLRHRQADMWALRMRP